jgi:hypothetical protein
MKILEKYANEISEQVRNGASVSDVMQLLQDFENQNWISVKEYLPENGKYVLTKSEHGVTETEFTIFNNGNMSWWAITRIGTYEDGQAANEVTHWRPLPDFEECLLA